MSETGSFSNDAEDRFDAAARFGFEDVQQRRLRYHLLRLTVVGLGRQDLGDLLELAALTFDDGDVTQQTAAIRQRADVSPLASAIARIMDRAARGVGGPVRMSSVMLGAVLGAYTAMRDAGGAVSTDAAIAGAVGGAVALTVSDEARHAIEQVGTDEYLRGEG